jgi:hypothetical protein
MINSDGSVSTLPERISSYYEYDYEYEYDYKYDYEYEI